MARAVNTNREDHYTPSANGTPLTWMTYWSGANRIGKTALDAPINRVSGSPIFYPAGNLVIEVPDGEFDGDTAEAMLRSAMGSTVQVRLHTSEPGDADDSNSNEASGGGYAGKDIAIASWTIT